MFFQPFDFLKLMIQLGKWGIRTQLYLVLFSLTIGVGSKRNMLIFSTICVVSYLVAGIYAYRRSRCKLCLKYIPEDTMLAMTQFQCPFCGNEAL